jgi:hypothetical protein
VIRMLWVPIVDEFDLNRPLTRHRHVVFAQTSLDGLLLAHT